MSRTLPFLATLASVLGAAMLAVVAAAGEPDFVWPVGLTATAFGAVLGLLALALPRLPVAGKLVAGAALLTAVGSGALWIVALVRLAETS